MIGENKVPHELTLEDLKEQLGALGSLVQHPGWRLFVNDLKLMMEGNQWAAWNAENSFISSKMLGYAKATSEMANWPDLRAKAIHQEIQQRAAGLPRSGPPVPQE